MKKNLAANRRPKGLITANGIAFIPFPADMVLDRELTLGAKALYMIYRSESNKAFQTDLANVKAAEYLGVSRGTIIRHKAELLEQGWIFVEERGEQGLPDLVTVYDNKAI